MDPVSKAELDAAVAALREHRTEDAIDHLNSVLVRAVDAEASDVEMFARGLLAGTLANTGKLERAREHADKALVIAEKLGDETGIASYGMLVQRLEDADAALGGELTVGMIDTVFEAATQALNRGDGADAVAQLAPLIDAAVKVGDAELEASAQGMTAQAYAMLGERDTGRRHAERALALAAELGDVGARDHFQALLDTLTDTDTNAAERIVEEAQIANEVHQACQAAGARLEAEDVDGAIQALLPAVERAAAAGVPEAEAQAREMLAQSLLVVGSRKEAETHARRALEIAESLGDEKAAENFREILKLAVGWVTPLGEA